MCAGCIDLLCCRVKLVISLMSTALVALRLRTSVGRRFKTLLHLGNLITALHFLTYTHTHAAPVNTVIPRSWERHTHAYCRSMRLQPCRIWMPITPSHHPGNSKQHHSYPIYFSLRAVAAVLTGNCCTNRKKIWSSVFFFHGPALMSSYSSLYGYFKLRLCSHRLRNRTVIAHRCLCSEERKSNTFYTSAHVHTDTHSGVK